MFPQGQGFQPIDKSLPATGEKTRRKGADVRPLTKSSAKDFGRAGMRIFYPFGSPGHVPYFVACFFPPDRLVANGPVPVAGCLRSLYVSLSRANDLRTTGSFCRRFLKPLFWSVRIFQ
jgi:hypothetical protein